MSKKQRCRDCAHADLASLKSMFKRISKWSVFPCTYPAPEFPVMPDSLTTSVDFSALLNRRRFMSPNDGQNCPVFKRAEKVSS